MNSTLFTSPPTAFAVSPAISNPGSSASSFAARCRLRRFHYQHAHSNTLLTRPSVLPKRQKQFVPRATAVSNPLPPIQSPTDENAKTNGNGNGDSGIILPTSVPNKQAPLLRFARSLLQHWKLLVPALIGGIVASVCAVLEPPQFGRILAILSSIHHARLSPDTAIAVAHHKQQLFMQIFVIASTYAVEMVATAVFISFAARAADRAIRDLRERIFQSTLANDVAYFDRVGRENIERAASVQLRIARQSFWDNLSEDRGLRAILEALFGIGMCLKLTGPVGIPIFCFLIPLLAFSVARLGLRSGRLNAKVEVKEADFVSFVNERLRGLRTLKAFGAEKKEFRDLTSFLNVTQQTIVSFIDTKSTTTCANRINIYVTVLIFFVFGGNLVSTGYMTFETFSSLIGFIWVLNFALSGLLFTFTDTAKASVALSNVYDIVDNAAAQNTLQQSYECAPTRLPDEFTGHVQFRDVSFAYPSRPDAKILDGVTFDMRPGQMVALVGESGGGKSTIAGLLCRFYKPSNGGVYLDGLDIHCLPAEIYARQLSVVDQEPFLFQGTIRANIAYGLPDNSVDDADIVRAAKEANAHDFITALPQGYDTVWSPGSNLSGGQRQRIAIARCLLKSPRMLVFDEPTSALDVESEKLVQEALEAIMEKRTTLIIAHRLSTIRSADVILFVKGGEITERGTFDELYAMRDGGFRALVDSSSAFAKNSAYREGEGGNIEHNGDATDTVVTTVNDEVIS